jgi:hypothetical protein
VTQIGVDAILDRPVLGHVDEEPAGPHRLVLAGTKG